MTFLELVGDYLTDVDHCLSLFQAKFGRRDLIRAWREGAIPPRGGLSHDVTYRMHGVGCAVEFSDRDVDFDFAGTTEVGFDAWRLWRYARQFDSKYGMYQSLEYVEIEMEKHVGYGDVVSINPLYKGESNGYLFRLNLDPVPRTNTFTIK